MINTMFASNDGKKLMISEGNTDHSLLFNYLPSMDMVEVQIMSGERIEARFTISTRDNQFGRKYEGLIGIEHYVQRIMKMLKDEDALKTA